jgi:hypothetical protein
MCDKAGPTLVVIKSSLNRVFGGYTAISWAGASGYSADPTAWIFSLTDKQQLMLNGDPRYAIETNASLLAIFGGGNDFYIVNNANTQNCSSNIYSYALPVNTTLNATTFLAGAKYFLVEEMEVF